MTLRTRSWGKEDGVCGEEQEEGCGQGQSSATGSRRRTAGKEGRILRDDAA